ncbi:hypothetical protein FI667_g7880, partial [Globisporangium splendens]
MQRTGSENRCFGRKNDPHPRQHGAAFLATDFKRDATHALIQHGTSTATCVAAVCNSSNRFFCPNRSQPCASASETTAHSGEKEALWHACSSLVHVVDTPRSLYAQTLFRSGTNNASNDDDQRGALKMDVCGGDARAEDSEPRSSQLNSLASSSISISGTAVAGGKFHSLKRKLFPNRVRRHPIRIPPLVVSPIAVQSNEMSVKTPPRSSNQSECQNDIRQSQKHSTSRTHSPEAFINREDNFSLNHATETDTLKTLQLPQSHDIASGGNMEHEGEEEDADLELERAIERLDNEAGNEADALQEMNRAIGDLHKWRQLHQRVTEDALREIELDNIAIQAQTATASNDDNVNTLEAEYEVRVEKKKQWGLQRQAQLAQLQHLSDTYQAALPKTTIDAHDEARVAQVLLEGHRQELGLENDSNGTAASHYDIDLAMDRTSNKASRLRDDIFDLGVRELSSTIQANLLDELEGADTELGEKNHCELTNLRLSSLIA